MTDSSASMIALNFCAAGPRPVPDKELSRILDERSLSNRIRYSRSVAHWPTPRAFREGHAVCLVDPTSIPKSLRIL